MNELTLHLKYEGKKPELKEIAQSIDKNLVERVEKNLGEILLESGVDNYTLKKSPLSLSPDLKFPDEKQMDVFFGQNIFFKTEEEKQCEASKEKFDEKIDQQIEGTGKVYPSGFTSEYLFDHVEDLEGYGVVLVGSPLYEKGEKYWEVMVAEQKDLGSIISADFLREETKSKLEFGVFQNLDIRE